MLWWLLSYGSLPLMMLLGAAMRLAGVGARVDRTVRWEVAQRPEQTIRGRVVHHAQVPLSVVVLLVISGWALLSIVVALMVAAIVEPRERADTLAAQPSVEDDRRRDIAS